MLQLNLHPREKTKVNQAEIFEKLYLLSRTSMGRIKFKFIPKIKTGRQNDFTLHLHHILIFYSLFQINCFQNRERDRENIF